MDHLAREQENVFHEEREKKRKEKGKKKKRRDGRVSWETSASCFVGNQEQAEECKRDQLFWELQKEKLERGGGQWRKR